MWKFLKTEDITDILTLAHWLCFDPFKKGRCVTSYNAECGVLSLFISVTAPSTASTKINERGSTLLLFLDKPPYGAEVRGKLMKNSIGYNASIGLHSTNHRIATPIYVGKASFYFSKATINATPRHNLQTSLSFCARFAVYFTIQHHRNTKYSKEFNNINNL